MKPPNIFIDSQGNIKLGDFGLAVKKASSDSKESLLQPSSPPPKNPNNPSFPTSNSSNNHLTNIEESPQLTATPAGGPNGPTPKLLRNVSELTPLTEVVGTTLYSSPEQAAEGVEYGSKADM